MTKKQLRQLYNTKRQLLSIAAYEDLSRRLLQQFKNFDFTGISCIQLFLPVLERREPDTFLIRHWLKAAHPYITLAFPKADFADYTMQSYADDGHLQLAVNSLGIPEPLEGTVIDEHQIDLIIVPLLAFDQQGYRVGYGKGFYDRFIASCRPDVQLVGLSFFDPVDHIEDLHAFDLPLHKCITPEKVWQFI